MNILTSRFGVVDIPPEHVYELTDEILGFPDTEHFFLLRKQNMAPFHWLQSVEEPGLTLVVVEPRHYFRYYRPRVNEFELRSVGASNINEVTFYVIVLLPDDINKMTANLRRPIIVNRKTGKMKQLRQSIEEYSFEESVLDGITRSESAKADLPNCYEVYLN